MVLGQKLNRKVNNSITIYVDFNGKIAVSVINAHVLYCNFSVSDLK